MRIVTMNLVRMRSLPVGLPTPQGAALLGVAPHARALVDSLAAQARTGAAGWGGAAMALTARAASDHLTHEQTTGIRAGARSTRPYHPSGPVPDPLLA